MNYIRGAVNVISAPYQYYKELPPLNPSTLTGAIDVIVVNTPSKDGTETELICTPFHVRFGKWQVLRPADKKVTLTVNGRPIPFNMKIGEAGEAFFIFETTDDVPDDLITSPLLSATQSPDLKAQNDNVEAEGFDAKERVSMDQTLPQGLNGAVEGEIQEPDFLDLDDSSRQPSPNQVSGLSLSKPSLQSYSEAISPSSLLTHTPHIAAAVVNAIIETEKETTHQLIDTARDILNTAQNSSYLNVDQVFPGAEQQDETQKPLYRTDVVLDMDGYHSRTRKDNEESSSALYLPPSPVLRGHSSSSPDISTLGVHFPNIRATSEPPPDVESSPPRDPLHERRETANGGVHLPVDEYMWEWGAFPQKSPISPLNTVISPVEFPKDDNADWKGQEPLGPADIASAYKDVLSQSPEAQNTEVFGIGGRLRPDREDPCLFTLVIEDKTIQFELSIVPPNLRVSVGVLGGGDEVEDAKIFNGGKIDFWKLLDDAQVLNDPNLVLRWSGDRYITRSDNSPLMDALSTWRKATLEDKNIRSASRSPSSASRSDRKDSSTDQSSSARTSSTSWVRWWSRSQRRSPIETSSSGPRPELRETTSAPGSSIFKNDKSHSLDGKDMALLMPSKASTLPSMRSESVRGVAKLFEEDDKAPPKKRYAKTLRLTSEQLKLLDLKPGPNTVTFSLSATGVAASTARIFVWDHTDRIVISDIDGTITKSDALGHVFTMIGRDWTHLGVAKLYTDICRNGYKIMYLTARAIGQADSTRYYLKGIKQNDYQLPEGPVIMSPDRLMASLHREVIMRKPEVFKMACLRDIRRLFGKTVFNPFYAGFGNRITDALSYRSVDVPSSRIFTIDSAGEVKMELLELVGYKSSYIHLTDLVDVMFPPIHRQIDSDFTDFNYWKPPMQEFELPDLTPPSPALSARSDTSNRSTLSRLRNLSIMGGRSTNTKQLILPPPATEGAGKDGRRGRENGFTHGSHVRQLSSLERFSRTFSAFAPSSSSTAASATASSSTFFDSAGEEDGEEEDLEMQKRSQRRLRRGSMPGSLERSDDELCFGQQDEEIDESNEYDGEGEEDEAAERAFDDDLFATGEMENVPFL